MEALAFTHSYITYENPDSDLKLRSFDELGLKIPSSAWIGLAGLAVALSVITVPTEAHAAYVRTNGRNLNIRSGPGIEFGVIGKLPNGTRVSLGRRVNGWIQVECGWVCPSWITKHPPRPKVTSCNSHNRCGW